MTDIKTKKDDRPWYVINGENQVLGRLASKVASILMGKHTPRYEKHHDHGGFVVILNAQKVKLTGRKLEQKRYKSFSGYPGGLKESTIAKVLKENPTYPVRHAVAGMLPKNSLGHNLLTKLKIYAGSDHPHKAQNPVEIKL